MRNALTIVLLLLVAVPGQAESVAPPAECVLSGTLKVAAKKGGATKKKLKKGSRIKVAVGREEWARVIAAKGKPQYARRDDLLRVCAGLASATAPSVVSPVAVAPAPAAAPKVATSTTAPLLHQVGAAAAFGDTPKIKLAVMDLSANEGFPRDVLTSLSAVVPEVLDRLGLFKAISSQDIVRLLQYESNQQLLGCNDDTCLAEVGFALGADYLVTGNLTGIGDKVVLQLQLMNIRESRVENRVSRSYTGAQSGLFEEVTAATQILVRELLGAQSGMLAVQVSEEGATLKVDGSVVGVSPMPPFALAGGMHELTVEKAEFIVTRLDVAVRPHETTPVQVEMRPSVEFIKRYEADASTVRTIALGSLGLGLASGLGAGVAYYLAGVKAQDLNDRVSDYNSESYRTSKRYSALSRREKEVARLDLLTLVGGGVAAVGIVTGVILWWNGAPPDRYQGTVSITAGSQSTWGVQLLPTGTGAVLSGEW